MRALVFHGAEDDQGRALFVVSALYHCSSSLRDLRIRFIAVHSLAVRVAVEVLAFETGLATETTAADPRVEPSVAFRDACLYGAVVFNECNSLGLEEAVGAGVPTIIATQFPHPADFTIEQTVNLRAAHDPAVFADLVLRSLS